MSFFVLLSTLSAVNRAEYVSDRVSNAVLRCRWYYISLLKAHALTEDRSDDSKEFPRRITADIRSLHIQVLLAFNAKLGSRKAGGI